MNAKSLERFIVLATQPGAPVTIPETLLDVLKQDGVVAIATLGQDGPHMVNTWNSYIRLTEEGRLLIPAGYMQHTEANIAFNDQVLVTLGSAKVAGRHGAGTGFLIKGTAAFIASGPDCAVRKAKFAWARATLAITPKSIEQTL